MRKINKYLIIMLLFCVVASRLSAQQMYAYRYWFDSDISQAQVDQSATAQFSLELDVSDLSEGMHQLNVQVTDTSGRYSPARTALFWKQKPLNVSSFKARYWFDDDAQMIESTTTSGLQMIDVSSLPVGMHTFNYQVAGDNGIYSPARTALFWKINQTKQVYTSKCFINDSLYHTQQVPAGSELMQLTFDVSNMPYGMHSLRVQIDNEQGEPVALAQRYFMRERIKSQYALTRCLYTIDGNTKYKEATSVQDGLFQFDVNTDSLSSGVHQLTCIVTDADNEYVQIRNHFFMKSHTEMVRYDYWVNTDTASLRVKPTPHRDSCHIVDMLEVNSYPFSSKSFNFEEENGIPYMYAKNDLHVKMYNSQGAYVQESRSYSDLSSKQVIDDISILNTGVLRTDSTPGDNAIRWYKIESDDVHELNFVVSQPCDVQLFAADGTCLLEASGEDVCDTLSCHVNSAGNYYLALHDVTGTAPLTSVYYQKDDARYFSLTYILDGKLHTTDSILYHDSILNLPEVPTKEGYTFSGWQDVPATMPAKDDTIKGFYSINTYALRYYVDDVLYAEDSVVYRDSVYARQEPTKEGYTFSGWQDVPATMPAKDDTISGKFTVNVYLLTLLLDNELFFSDSLAYGTDLIQPEVPVKEGYTFSGWNDLPATMPAKDVQCEAFYVLDEKQHDSQGLLFALNATRDAFEVIAYADTLQASLVIPTDLYGLPVTAIAPGALAGAGHLRSIEIPSSIQTVGEGAFSECYQLLTIEWNSPAALRAACFDEPEAYGNMLVFCKTAEPAAAETKAAAEPAGQAAADELFAGNVVIDGVAENIRLTDGRPFSNPRNFTAKNITYSRYFGKQSQPGQSAGWEAMVLPFDVQSIVNEEKACRLAPFGLADYVQIMPMWVADWKASDNIFVESSLFQANKPFIVQVPNNAAYYEERFNMGGTIVFSAQDVQVSVSQTSEESLPDAVYQFSGTYESQAAASDVYALNDDVYQTPGGDMIAPGGVFVAALREVRPFEAYVRTVQVNTQQPNYLRIGKDLTTGIEKIWLQGPQEDIWYNLQGIRLLSRPTQPGLYIHNGKKVIVK